MAELARHRVPTFEKFAFGLRAFSQQVGSNGITLFAFPAYGMILGLDPALIGLVFALMRLYDGFTDPLMGWLSDSTRSRWGRRRPYIFIGAILGGISFSLLWLAQPEWTVTLKTMYFVLFSLLFYTCYTVMTVPGDALGWELTPDYAERTRVMTWFSTGVKLTALVLPWMFALTQAEVWESEAEGLRYVGIAFGVIFAVTGVVPAFVCKERNFQIASAEGKLPLMKTLGLCFKNRTYLITCGFTLFILFGGTVYMLFGTHLAVYYLFAGNRMEGAQFFGIFATFASVVGLMTLFVINRFFVESDKRKVVLFACATVLVGWLLGIFLITPKFPWLTLIPIGINAIGVSTFWLLIGSILADVADEDEYKNGYRREGALASFISFLGKLAGTLGALLGGFALSFSGFDASFGQQNSATLLTMKIIYVGFPLFGYSMAFLLALVYPLDKVTMLEIRRALEQRRGSSVAGS